MISSFDEPAEVTELRAERDKTAEAHHLTSCMLYERDAELDKALDELSRLRAGIEELFPGIAEPADSEYAVPDEFSAVILYGEIRALLSASSVATNQEQ